jgi:hypothetical protein
VPRSDRHFLPGHRLAHHAAQRSKPIFLKFAHNRRLSALLFGQATLRPVGAQLRLAIKTYFPFSCAFSVFTFWYRNFFPIPEIKQSGNV